MLYAKLYTSLTGTNAASYASIEVIDVNVVKSTESSVTITEFSAESFVGYVSLSYSCSE